MSRDRAGNGSPPESVISIIGPGTKVVGDMQTDGTIRIEGAVYGSVQAGKAVVVGREGSVEGDITTQDAVVAGAVHGTLVAESRLELQATCRIDGEVYARRMQLEEGAVLNGTVQMGDSLRREQTAPMEPGTDSPGEEAFVADDEAVVEATPVGSGLEA
jgi:cytoskeletal protein CcmA (bactofilin family)